MTTQEHAKYLNNKYGFNVVPLKYLKRDYETGDKFVETIEWKKYKAEQYPLDKWDDSYTALMIMTGQISNLTVLDIDSEEALDTLLNHLELSSVEDLADYIVKTFKGYQLFYTYEPNTRTRIGIQNKIDFLNGGVTFAVDTNQSYKTIKDSKPSAMPQALKDLIIGTDGMADITIKDFERAIRENSDLPYKFPLQPLIKDFIDAGKIGRNIKKELEKVFCTKDFKDYSLEDFSKPGQIHTSMMYVGGIVAANPTISKDLFISFIEAWAKKVAKIDITDLREQQLIANRVKGCMNYFRYDSAWKQKSDEAQSPSRQAEAAGFKTWYNPVDDKYAIYHPIHNHTDWYSTSAYKIAIVRDVLHREPESTLKVADVDPTKAEKVYETFDPTVDDEFFINPTDGRAMHNNFKRSKMLSYFQTCTPSTTMPDFLGKILTHTYPNKDERDMFLHTLAYHMTYLIVSPTCYILTGKSGTGKNIVLQQVLSLIYEKNFLRMSAKDLTSRFRSQLKNKLLIFIDEVNEKGKSYAEQGSLHNVIKQVVANSEISIEAKGKDTETYPNHSLITMASNSDEPFKLDEGFDRRINITKTNNENLRDLKWFPYNLSTLEIDELIESEVPAFVEYLASIELDHKKWSTTIENVQRKSLIASSVPLIDQYVDAITSKDVETLHELDYEFGEWFENRFIRDNRYSVSVKELKEQLGLNIGAQVIKKLKSSGVLYKKIDNIRSLVLNTQGQKELDKVEPI